MKRRMLKEEIRMLICGEADPKRIVEIYYVNTLTGEKTLFGKYPSEKGLKVEVDKKGTI
jgi:hypothetical protein